MRFRIFALFALSLAAGLATYFNQPATAADEKIGARAGQFDFYVLALSWSPSYCLAEGDRANKQQCGNDKQFGFIVHGLWPQYEAGYPSRCASRQSDRVPNVLAENLLDIMPSFGLIGHQWRKHGTCSGLDQKAYFDVTRAAFEAITIPTSLAAISQQKSLSPQAMEQAFIAANAGMSADGIAVACDRENLSEVRICLTKDLAFRPCAEVNANACRAKKTVIPPINAR